MKVVKHRGQVTQRGYKLSVLGDAQNLTLSNLMQL